MFGTSIDEADMGINARFAWSTNGTDDFDPQTVLIHELGHMLGLGHSGIPEAAMFASDHGVAVLGR